MKFFSIFERNIKKNANKRDITNVGITRLIFRLIVQTLILDKTIVVVSYTTRILLSINKYVM